MWGASLLCVLGLATPAEAQYTRKITLSVGAGVVSGPHADFPVLVDVTNADLQANVQSPQGYDIVFRGEDTTTCGGPATCMLAHEIESYNAATGHLIAWVHVPSLVASTSAIHMYYGNAAITSPTESPEGVFDADYVGVWHLGETGNGSYYEYRDSSAYGNHGQGGQGDAPAVPKAVAAGQIGGAQRFDGLGDGVFDFIDAGQDGSLNITGDQITLQAWVKQDVTPIYSAGLASVTATFTTVTLVGGVFPASVVPESFIDFTDGANSEFSLRVLTRDSDTQLTLRNPAVRTHTNSTYVVRPGPPYGILNRKGYDHGYRFFLQGDSTRCPNPSGTLTDACLGVGLPEPGQGLASSQYGPYPFTGPGATDPVTQGVWHHVVAAYDGAEMKLYVDGQKLIAEASGGTHQIDSGSCGAKCAQIAGGIGGTVVTFNSTLPAGVAAGQVLTFVGSPVENFVIQSVLSGTQVTVLAAGANHSLNQAYRITDPSHTGNLLPSMAEQHLWIGTDDQPQNKQWTSPYVGELDEVRISRIARSDGWIETEFNNQNAPGGFYSIGGPVGAALAPAPTVNYRSIGTAANYSANTISVTAASTVVTGTSTAWASFNRGQGDRITICDDPPGCSTNVDYTIFSVDSDTSLQLTAPYAGTTGPGKTYVISRKFSGPIAWENCVDGGSPPACENAPTSNLIADNRSEVGILYADGSAYLQSGGNPVVNLAGATTDPAHNVTLTVAPGNRHLGVPDVGNTGVVFDNTGSAVRAVWVQMEHVFLEWLEIKGGTGPGIEFGSAGDTLAPANLETVRNTLIHDLGGDGILVSDADTNVDIHNNFIFNANNGIRLAVDLATGARVNLFNNTIYNSTSRGIASRNGGGSLVRQTTHQVTLRNNIVHTSGTVDIDVARPFDEAYFCTTVDGSQNPTTCGADIAPALGDETTNQTLAFTGVNTACLYVGSSQMFRGVGVSVVSPPSGSGANLQWDYWNGSSWASLETGTFADYNFSWDGFAYWADDPSGWVTRTVGGGGALYYARVCRSGSDSSPTEKLISRADVSLPS
ncbi:MAG: DUF2341 domain-containing protein, partial [Acidobacteriota bacterium]